MIAQCLALLITKAFMVSVCMCGCCRRLTLTTDSVMVWLKRRPYTRKYIFILLKYMNWLFSFLQAISVYGILSADQLVLGLARQKSEGSATELCCEQD